MKSTHAAIHRHAREVFGWDELRPRQAEAVEAALSGRDVLAVMPTGYGKSAVYQLAGVLAEGPCVVVSPLIALQADQRDGLNELPVGAGTRAVAINSSFSARKQEQAWQSVENGEATFLFLTPEQLAKDDVLARVRDVRPAFLAVDEAHCVSAWGHDFRPDYLRLGTARHRLGSPTIIALTATASTPVRQEIVEGLAMDDPLVIALGFDRPNLHLAVERHHEDSGKRESVLEQVAGLPHPGLLYTATRRAAADYAAGLRERGLAARAYHAGLKTADREETLQRFLDGAVDVVVATSAFGMGIDKADVRFVVHADITDSLDTYYQEAGRAGRDGQEAQVVLHYRSEDLGLRSFFSTHHADQNVVVAVVRELQRAEGPLRLTHLKGAVDVSARRVTGTVNLLQAAGAVASSRKGLTLVEGVGPKTAARLAEETAERMERIDGSRIEMMRGYAETDGCRRQYLLGYFGEELADPCGNCDACDAGTAEDLTHDDAEFALQSGVVHREWGRGLVMSVNDDRITVLFEEQGYRTLSLEAVREQGLLTRT
ncbi:RecQ family ATP-dependent DNA helicase [Citricoccus muralis]|uniref:ATP-dependent DNA helicase RecQ n=1 Tax=Citricoccus muralis TaxID=169134 RepID=A0A3D9LEV8_9MICC|nr:RecQ family ATP-dependent DNA helicase [Citricoccus muralis]REE04702.1 ATP-dependent DNA helicase RecQ [Citricoccus muralis]